MIKAHVDESIGLLINRIKNKLKCRMADRLKKYDLTTEQRAILLVLAEKGAMTQVKVCELTGAEPSNMCVTLKRLIAKELAQKIDHPEDARAYLVEATPKAMELAPILQSFSEQINGSLLEGISGEDMAVTMRSLKKMHDNLQ
jgi:MarR family transcriptional regulator, organic hydroperoxide resistance regulator